MIDASFDCAFSPGEDEGSVGGVGWGVRAGDSIKDLTQ